MNECWPAPGMVVEGIHIEDIFNLSPWSYSFLNYILDIRILAHEEDQYTVMFIKYQADFLSIALKQSKAGPRSWGTPVLDIIIVMHRYAH